MKKLSVLWLAPVLFVSTIKSGFLENLSSVLRHKSFQAQMWKDKQEDEKKLAFINALKSGDEKLASLIFSFGIGNNLQDPATGEPLLNMATRNGRLHCVRLLLEAGANPNERPTDIAITPLHIAAQNDSPEIVELLIQYGAFVNVEWKYNQTPLDMAITRQSPRSAKILLAAGAQRACQLENY